MTGKYKNKKPKYMYFGLNNSQQPDPPDCNKYTAHVDEVKYDSAVPMPVTLVRKKIKKRENHKENIKKKENISQFFPRNINNAFQY